MLGIAECLRCSLRNRVGVLRLPGNGPWRSGLSACLGIGIDLFFCSIRVFSFLKNIGPVGSTVECMRIAMQQVLEVRKSQVFCEGVE